MGNFLGLDCSTQSMTGLVIDTEAGALLAEESIGFDEHFAERYGVDKGILDLGGGRVHSPPLMWAEALERLFGRLREAGVDLGRIEAVAGSGQQHGTVYLNEAAAGAFGSLDPDHDLTEQLAEVFSRPTAPIWMDTSTGEQCRQIEDGVGGRGRLLELTGNTAFERFSGPQIRRFWQDDPEAYERTSCISLVSSFVASLLAGRLVPVDPGDGSGTNLMDIRTRRWSPAALEATAPNLGRRLLPVIPSDVVAGTLSPFWTGRFGFAPDCRVLPFSGDNPCSLIGLGLLKPGQAALSLGTSDTLFACLGEPRLPETGEGALFASPDGSHYMALICFLNGSLAREAVRDRYGLDWAGFSEGLAATPPGNGGALMLPWFDEEIVPRVTRPGVVRQDLDESDPAANVRAVIEAQALSSRIHSEWMGVEIRSLRVTGGASENEEILRVFADVHGCPVQRLATTNAAALGAAFRAAHGHAKASGEERSWEEVAEPFLRLQTAAPVEPDPANRGVYDGMLEGYRELEGRHAEG